MLIKNKSTSLVWDVNEQDTINRCLRELDSEGNKVYEEVQPPAKKPGKKPADAE